MYSRWVDMQPNGTPVEGRGIRPDVVVDLPEAAYEEADPTWEKAVDVLRARVKRNGGRAETREK
jgi:C-terminal processing protease CtpA/Prc